MRLTHTLSPLIILSFLLLLGGCNNLNTNYGKSTATDGRRSIAGFGVLREYYSRQGWTDRTVGRLSERLNNIDTIVWTPDSTFPPTNEVTVWFEEWLARGDKTLVYVLKDHQTVHEYWDRASRFAPPRQRVEYRRRLARARIENRQSLLSRNPKITNGWFTADALTPVDTAKQLKGPWAEDIDAFDDSRIVEYQLRPYDSAKDSGASTPGATGMPGTVAFPGFFDYTPTSTKVNFDVLLENQSGVPLVVKVTNADWVESSIIVVSSGSLLTNFGLLDSGSRRLAAKIVAESSRNDDGLDKVGFLASDDSSVPVSSLDPKQAGPTGMELFTVWPLNILTIHLFVASFVVCLWLFPIFGRPRRLPPRGSGDFALHIDAVAGLMRKTSSTQYARIRISEYMVRVRGEHEGPWVIKEAPKVKIPEVSVAPSAVATSSENVVTELTADSSDNREASNSKEVSGNIEATVNRETHPSS